jgi:hypothetical protein
VGNSSYDFTARSTATAAYCSQSFDTTFEQQKQRMIHESMNPKTVKLRECRDSVSHPNTVPIVLGMDVTGSMGKIPHDLVMTGLPKLMSSVINGGVPDAALLFLAVGDHKSDRFPIQVGQFESGDAELDMWLTRTYIEGNGGGNGGESYSLVWDFANRFVVTDAWEKRQQKGFIFTFGDEYIHDVIPSSFLNSTYSGTTEEASLTTAQILKKMSQKWHFVHIHIEHGSNSKAVTGSLRAILGEHLVVTEDYTKIPEIIANYVIKNTSGTENSEGTTRVTVPTDTDSPDIIL